MNEWTNKKKEDQMNELTKINKRRNKKMKKDKTLE